MKEKEEIIYRYRPDKIYLENNKIKTIVEELKNQEIFFASIEENNDPMDGACNVFWEGDEILWNNFLYHYLYCLYLTCKNTLLIHNNMLIDYSHILVELTPIDYVKIIKHEEIDYLFESLNQNKMICKIRTFLTNMKKLNINSLSQILAIYNKLFFEIVDNALEKYHQVQFFYMKYTSKEDNILEKSIEALDKLDFDKLEKVYELNNVFSQSLMMLSEYKNLKTDDENYIFKKNIASICSNFGQMYLKACVKLVFPKFYLSCFSKNKNNSSMWGHYSAGHKGIVLIFKPEQYDDKWIIEFENKMKLTLFDIDYKDSPPNLNFFENLGMVKMRSIEKFWMKDNGKKSDYSYTNIDLFRQNYWSNYYKKVSHKFTDWSQENETRCILSHDEDEDINKRILRYKFNMLVGIIFGINTDIEVKKEILSVLEEKCKKTNRNDFKVYQAIYSEKNNKIMNIELSMINKKLFAENKRDSQTVI